MLAGDHVTALEAFQRYLADGGDAVSPERKQQVELQLARLEGQVAWLSISTNVAGAEIRVDGQRIGKTPLSKPVALNPGRHSVVASKDPLAPVRQETSVAAGERHALHLVIIERSSAADTITTSSVAAPRQRRLTNFWITAGATGALVVSAGLTGLFALRAEGELEDELGRYPASPRAIDDARVRVRRFSLATDLLLGASAIGAGFSIYFLIAETRSGEARERRAAGLQITPGSLAISGRF